MPIHEYYEPSKMAKPCSQSMNIISKYHDMKDYVALSNNAVGNCHFEAASQFLCGKTDLCHEIKFAS